MSVGVYDFALLMTLGMGKPLSPRSARCFFDQVLQERGIPADVLSVVQTTSAGAVTGPLITDARLR